MASDNMSGEEDEQYIHCDALSHARDSHSDHRAIFDPMVGNEESGDSQTTPPTARTSIHSVDELASSVNKDTLVSSTATSNNLHALQDDDILDLRAEHNTILGL